MRAREILGSSHSRPPSFFALATGESALTRPEQQRAEHRAPPTVERCLLPLTPDESGTRSSCRACQNGGAGPRMIRRNARTACARFRAAAATIWPPVPSPSVRFAEAPTRLTCLETAADQKRRRPRNQLPALACAQWRARKQPHRSRLLRALVREQLIG